MSVIFQLFRASDLAQLSAADLEKFKKEVGLALNNVDVLKEVKKRADEVFQQLTGVAPRPKPYLSLLPTPADLPLEALREYLSNERLSQLFSPEDLASLDAKNRSILQMAIDCELVHSEHVLLEMKKIVRPSFTAYPGVTRVEGHDRPFFELKVPEGQNREDVENYVHIPPDDPPPTAKSA